MLSQHADLINALFGLQCLKTGLTVDVDGLDDVKDFAVMEKSMNDCGFDGNEKANVFRVTAAVLHIGQIDFEEDGQGNAGSRATARRPSLVSLQCSASMPTIR